MRYKNDIKNICLSGILCGLGIVLAAFGRFTILGGTIYLVGAAVFLLPLLVPFIYAFITGITIVVIADYLGGYIASTWISVIAYGLAIIILWIFKKLKFKLFYIIGVILASGVAILTYYIFDMTMFDKAYAIKDLIATSIQFAIIFPVVIILYLPVKIIGII